MMINIHGTAVALFGKAVLLRGQPGSGKSDLALKLIDRGATLISDDQVLVEKEGRSLFLSAPESIANLLEIRGLGIVYFDRLDHVRLALIVDLSSDKNLERLPEPCTCEIEGCRFPQLKLEAKRESLHIIIELAMAKLCDERDDLPKKETWGL